MSQLYKNHRTLGYEAGRTREGDTELVVLRTSDRAYDVAAAHRLMPATAADVALTIRFELAELLSRARFLGLDNETIHELFSQELNRE